jgi:hypothetical protein
LCYGELNLSAREVKTCTLKEFFLLLNGYYRRNEEEWDRTRNIMAFQLNYGGLGLKNPKRPQDIIKLKRDEAKVKKPIRTLAQAMEMLNEFK